MTKDLAEVLVDELWPPISVLLAFHGVDVIAFTSIAAKGSLAGIILGEVLGLLPPDLPSELRDLLVDALDFTNVCSISSDLLQMSDKVKLFEVGLCGEGWNSTGFGG